MSASERVAAGVAALVVSDSRLLMGRRYEDGQFSGWQCPGGYLQPSESIEEAVQRCCRQRAGIEIEELKPGPYTNNIFQDQDGHRHTVTLYQLAHTYRVVNEALFEQWQWFDIGTLPQPLFLPLNELMRNHQLSELIVP